jgi:hypothetical protein
VGEDFANVAASSRMRAPSWCANARRSGNSSSGPEPPERRAAVAARAGFAFLAMAVIDFLAGLLAAAVAVFLAGCLDIQILHLGPAAGDLTRVRATERSSATRRAREEPSSVSGIT